MINDSDAKKVQFGIDAGNETAAGAPDRQKLEFQKAYQIERALDSLGGSIDELNEFWQTYFGSIQSLSTAEANARETMLKQMTFVNSVNNGWSDGRTTLSLKGSALGIVSGESSIAINLAALNGSSFSTITDNGHSFWIMHNQNATELSHFLSQPFVYETQSRHVAKEAELRSHATKVHEVLERNRSSIIRRLGIGKEQEPEKPKHLRPHVDRYDAALALISRVHDALEAAKASLSSRVEKRLPPGSIERAA